MSTAPAVCVCGHLVIRHGERRSHDGHSYEGACLVDARPVVNPIGSASHVGGCECRKFIDIKGTDKEAEGLRAVGATSRQNFEYGVDKVLATVRAHVLAKNAAYGDSALNPVRIFSKSDTDEALRVRLDDKLSRMARGDVNAFAEDPTLDIMGYLVLLEMKRNAS